MPPTLFPHLAKPVIVALPHHRKVNYNRPKTWFQCTDNLQGFGVRGFGQSILGELAPLCDSGWNIVITDFLQSEGERVSTIF